jgi:hypothetical protein
MKIDPKFSNALSAGTKIRKNLVNGFYTSGRVAVLHLASDDGLAASEDAIRTLGEKGHPVVSVDERKI